MKNILIITSHYPPSNLAGVHRGRLFAKYLPQYDWNPIVLTVHENYYEEKLDFELNKLLPRGQHIEKVNAFPITKPRMIGDLGLRAFFQLRKRANKIIKEKKIDFIYIIIPSFYLTLLAPYLNVKDGIKIGIDYMDPWVHTFPGSEHIFSRHWWSTKLSKYLESYVLKYVSLITSVAPNYVQPIFIRNPQLKLGLKTLFVPCGWDADEQKQLMADYWVGEKQNEHKKYKLIYAGAYLPKSDEILIDFLHIIDRNIHVFQDVEIHFIGTGLKSNSSGRSSITEHAARLKLLNDIIYEHPKRISYLDLLHTITSSSGIFILGSTEAHYTPSKLFNAFVTQKPIFAILHPSSSAKAIIEEAQWGITTTYSSIDKVKFENDLISNFNNWKSSIDHKNWSFNLDKASVYAAHTITGQLADAINSIVK